MRTTYNIKGILITCLATGATISDAESFIDLLHNTGQGMNLWTQDSKYTLSATDMNGNVFMNGSLPRYNMSFTADPRSEWVGSQWWLDHNGGAAAVGDSAWLSPSIGIAGDNNVLLATSAKAGWYTFTYSFDVGSLRPESITGRWASDNDGEIYLNGISTGFKTDLYGFKQWSYFSLSNGLHSGINTLEFVIKNIEPDYESDGIIYGNKGIYNPTGVRVEYLSATGSAVPGPAAAISMVVGYGLTFARSRRKKRVG